MKKRKLKSKKTFFCVCGEELNECDSCDKKWKVGDLLFCFLDEGNYLHLCEKCYKKKGIE